MYLMRDMCVKIFCANLRISESAIRIRVTIVSGGIKALVFSLTIFLFTYIYLSLLL